MRFVTKLKSMPETLAGLSCLFLLCGALMIIAAIFAGDVVDPEGNKISREEFWKSGGGPWLIFTGVVMIVFSVGVFRRIRWVRYAWPIFFVGMLIHALLARPEHMAEQIIASIAWFLISSWYFFRRASVVRYFQATA